MASQVVQVRRETLKACITCPLCNKLLKEATTISLCLHTFCRKCIYEKLSDEEVDCCPVCNIDLGCLPVEKLRPDHNLQDLRSKIFPFKQRKVKAPEVIPSISLPIKRKERSLSSLVVSTPEVSVQTGLTGRRTKPVSRKSSILRGCRLAVEVTKKEQDCPVSSGSPNKVAHNRRQNTDEDIENDGELIEGKADLWTPLNCLVEAANRTKSSKFNSEGTHLAKLEPLDASCGEPYPHSSKTKDEPLSARESESYTPKTKLKVRGHKTRMQDHKNGITSRPGPTRHRRLRPVGHKRSTGPEDSCVIDDAGIKQNRRTSPIWFSLVASEDQKGDVSLPQISAGYLRLKDASVPVSLIQKYLVKKLDLASETEVEIMCRGQPVLPSLELHNLVDLWFRAASTSKKVPASVGSSAKDFVMVLSYCRKIKAP